jgi:hypothetical protein
LCEGEYRDPALNGSSKAERAKTDMPRDESSGSGNTEASRLDFFDRSHLLDIFDMFRRRLVDWLEGFAGDNALSP